jgi:TonB-dependent receptor
MIELLILNVIKRSNLSDSEGFLFSIRNEGKKMGRITLMRLAILSMIIVVMAFEVWAANGSVEGIVKDAQTGSALPGANILLEGTSLGAASESNGKYSLQNIPPGSYTIRATYIGYESQTYSLDVKEGVTIEQDFELKPVGVKGKEVIVTAQASGQNAAINKQLASNKIVNVVSADRIQGLPDANAAESVGRLPGAYLLRSGGEGYEVAIRGLEPQYNEIMINGVRMSATSPNGRSVDMSMISSDMLSGIEVYKTITPDMDAAVLGGVVNFQMREASQSSFKKIKINLSVQGGYNNLQKTYNDYKFTGTIEKRFINNKFGILAQGVIEKKNLSADAFGGSYNLQSFDYYNPGPVILQSLVLKFSPSNIKRNNAALVMDYQWNTGNISSSNFLSRSNRVTETFSQSYDIGTTNTITYTPAYTSTISNIVSNILNLQQSFSAFKVNAKLSHTYTENISDSWNVGFQQLSAGLGSISQSNNPESIAKEALKKAKLDQTFLQSIGTNNDFTRGRKIGASIDFTSGFNFSDFLTASLKFGGSYLYTFRSYDHSQGSGNLYFTGNNDARAAIIKANPWMAQPPYNLNTGGTNQFPISMFYDKSRDFGTFLSGNYEMLGYPENIDLLSNIINTVKKYQIGVPYKGSTAYSPAEYGDIDHDYLGYEYENAFYVMTTVNFGPQLALIPGVRYQGLQTKYKAAIILTANQLNTYPRPFPHTDTTVTQYHGFWLPDVTLRYKPFTWFDARLSYTNSITYPNFNYIAPEIDVNLTSVNWNNYLLKPARSQNYDLAVSFYNNTIGLFSIDPFLKQINDFIFSEGDVYLTDPSQYPGLPSYTSGYLLNTQINNPYRVDLWGLELEWQTHFWYLPSILKGLVFNINYTHIFSGAKYPFVLTKVTGYPPVITHVDTAYTDRLIDQPSNIVNLSVGYDFKGFSMRVSMIYQADVFSAANFFPSLRKSTASYTRWDFSAKQNLPWFGIQTYLDINNINSEPDISLINGTGFPSNEQSYGLTANLGLRWNL